MPEARYVVLAVLSFLLFNTPDATGDFETKQPFVTTENHGRAL